MEECERRIKCDQRRFYLVKIDYISAKFDFIQ